jgi:hypothetical protein
LRPGQLIDFSPPPRIYGYLLDGEYARTGRKWSSKGYHETFDLSRSGPRAYHFHTGILGVNRAIHDEAEELLYKRNVFVVLSYQYSGLGNDIGGLIWLPIVSNKHAARMQKHSVRIHITSGTGKHRSPDSCIATSIQSAIFLARDLGAFCLIMTAAGS